MIQESLAKVNRGESSEFGADKADNWIYITPRTKAKGSGDNHNFTQSKAFYSFE